MKSVVSFSELSWKTWVGATCLLSAHTALVILMVMYTCGSSDSHTPTVDLAGPSSAHLAGQKPTSFSTKHAKATTSFTTDIDNEISDAPKNNTNDATVQENKLNTTSSNETEVNITKPTTKAPTLSDYLHIDREKPINNFGYKYATSNDGICTDGDGEGPVFLLILCMSKDFQKTRRDSIRATWGTVVKTESWPRMQRKFSGVKLVFLVGQPPGHTSKYDTAIQNENDEYGDVVQADFVDNVQNASMKTILGLKWIQELCPGAKFVLRVGDDQFVHVANLMMYLEHLEVPEEGFIIGYNASNTNVARKGFWEISEIVYPFDTYPAFVRKLSYVISGNIIDDISSDAQFMPYIFIEDVYITGVLRSAVGASLFHNAGFVTGGEPRPKLCGFHNEFRLTANTNPSLTLNLWKSLHRNLKNCYTPKR